MKNITEQTFIDAIRYEMGIDDSVNVTDDVNAEYLWNIADRHDLAHLVADVLMKKSIVLENQDAWIKARKKAIYRYMKIKNVLEETEKAFNEAGIDFIPLKGAVIRKYYPEEWMRTSCDIDILVHKSDIDKAKTVLKEKNGYTEDTDILGSHDVHFHTPLKVHIELHYALIEKNRLTGIDINEKAWDEIKPSESHKKEFTDEFLYCYNMAHIEKHFKSSGGGIRLILDTWILKHKLALDEAKKEKMLEDSKITQIEEKICKLGEVWFGNQTGDEETDLLEKFFLKNAIYGTQDAMVAFDDRERISGIICRLFPKSEQLEKNHPILKEKKYLYPYYAVRRIFSCFGKKKRKNAGNELKRRLTISDEERRENKRVKQVLGLE